jgi:hypothetical protein
VFAGSNPVRDVAPFPYGGFVHYIDAELLKDEECTCLYMFLVLSLSLIVLNGTLHVGHHV